MRFEEFEQNFIKLCTAYGCQNDNRHNQCLEYFESNLKNISSCRFNELIKKAKNEIVCKTGFIPQVAELNKIAYTLDRENFNASNKKMCSICGNTGYVTMETPDKYKYSCCFLCICAVGRDKALMTKIGRLNQPYTMGIEKGYKPVNFKVMGNVPF